MLPDDVKRELDEYSQAEVNAAAERAGNSGRIYVDRETGLVVVPPRIEPTMPEIMAAFREAYSEAEIRELYRAANKGKPGAEWN